MHALSSTVKTIVPTVTGHGSETFVSLTGRNGLAILTKEGRRYFIGCDDVDALNDAFAEVPLKDSSSPS